MADEVRSITRARLLTFGPVLSPPDATSFEVPIVQAWVCDQPARGVGYRVLRDEWLKDGTIRVIYEIELAE